MIRVFTLIILVAVSPLVVQQSIGQQKNVMNELAFGYAMRACVYRSLLDHIRMLMPPDVVRKRVLKECGAEISTYRASGGNPSTIISDGMKFYSDAYLNLRMK